MSIRAMLKKLHADVANLGASRANTGDLFVDLPRIYSLVEKTKERVLYRQARYVQKTTRNSIKKYTGKASRPGEPPKDRHNQKKGGKSRMKDIRFRKEGDTIRIGPHVYDGGTDLPGILDKGGEISQTLYRDGKPWMLQQYTMEPRPYTQPAYERSKPKLRELMKNALHKSGIPDTGEVAAT